MAGPDIKRSRRLWPLLARAAVVAGGVSLLLRRVQPSPTPSALDEAGRANGAAPPSAKSRGQGHETEDMSGGLMAGLALFLGTVVCVVVFGMIEVRTWIRSSYVSDQPALTALQTAPITPPGPHLQADPVKDINQLRAKEDALLHGYAWVDPAHTRARIPIDRALALTVGRSLEHAP